MHNGIPMRLLLRPFSSMTRASNAVWIVALTILLMQSGGSAKAQSAEAGDPRSRPDTYPPFDAYRDSAWRSDRFTGIQYPGTLREAPCQRRAATSQSQARAKFK